MTQQLFLPFTELLKIVNRNRLEGRGLFRYAMKKAQEATGMPVGISRGHFNQDASAQYAATGFEEVLEKIGLRKAYQQKAGPPGVVKRTAERDVFRYLFEDSPHGVRMRARKHRGPMASMDPQYNDDWFEGLYLGGHEGGHHRQWAEAVDVADRHGGDPASLLANIPVVAQEEYAERAAIKLLEEEGIDPFTIWKKYLRRSGWQGPELKGTEHQGVRDAWASYIKSTGHWKNRADKIRYVPPRPRAPRKDVQGQLLLPTEKEDVLGQMLLGL